MKHFTFRLLKRLYITVAISLVLLAILISGARILFISIDDYKEQAIRWLTSTYEVEVSIDDISAGIDFSGMVLILNNVSLLDSDELPFSLTFEHLFIHLNFWDSVKQRQLNFNSISLQGADLTLKNRQGNASSSESQLTINTLKKTFLTQLKTFSIKDSHLNFTNQIGHHKTIRIDQLRWLNIDDHHRGIGKASFLNTFGGNSMKFVMELYPEKGEEPLAGNLYLQAKNLNIADYLVEQVNDNAKVIDAVLGAEAWVNFSVDKIKSIQLKLNKSHLNWSQLDSTHSWELNSGLLQLSNSKDGWLFDSYNLDIRHNQKPLKLLSISGQGDQRNAKLNFNGLTVKDVIPFYLLSSNIDDEQITLLTKLGIDANIDNVQVANLNNQLQFDLKLSAFKNHPVGPIPGVSNANIRISGGENEGSAHIHLPKQKFYFDKQFSRTMPVTSGDISLQWLQTEAGFKLFSEQALFTTNELDTQTDFSIFFPNATAANQSIFLSLYSYASLNDASKAQYYFPIKAMGNNVFNYLEPTIKQGRVKGAKILWYGAFNHYPYESGNGIFQAWVPLRDAQYDFYGKWQGLTNLDLDLLFENDYLLMDAKRASLAEVDIAKLTAKVDHLNPNGILTINADISDDAQKISDYLKGSPLKESVGKALQVLEVNNLLSGNITLTVPFNREVLETQTVGEVYLKKNSLNIALADDLQMPLTDLSGHFSFINGNLKAENLEAKLFDQAINVSFSSAENKESYQVDAQIDGIWKLTELSHHHEILAPLKASGHLDWSGQVNFEHHYKGGYEFDVQLNSAMQGILTQLPAPFHKNAFQAWPMWVNVSGSDNSTKMKLSIKDKLAFEGVLDYKEGQQFIPYLNLSIGQSQITNLDKSKQIVNISLDKLNLTDWYEHWLIEKDKALTTQPSDEMHLQTAIISLDEVNVDIKHLDIFQQPLTMFNVNAYQKEGKWDGTVFSDRLQTRVEYRPGIPARFDFEVKKINLQDIDVTALQSNQSEKKGADNYQSENLRADYAEIFVNCQVCIYKDIDFSPLSLHIYPTKKRLNIDYLKIGGESEFTHLSGFWNQRITNVILDIEADRNNSILKRLGYSSPVSHRKAQLSGAFNWVGAPWQANLVSLNGAFSSQFNDGAITEVSDKGARLLSLFSLDGIRRSLNLEFDNVFDKGFNFDVLKLTGNINDGVISSDDFYLDGSAGKIIGDGLIDLPNSDTNYNFSYSPAVTSSLPVLAAFTINPLTGAAVLMLTKILEPVVDTIIRVDFTVKGELTNPEINLVTREKGQVKLDKSEVLQEMSERQEELRGRNHDL